ncbi:head-tail adaptor protein [Pseudotabrizicola sp. 4114]|uniref:phage head completion protein n=1 Tax=Pseudotabrizicola sp. 4114 TaxID=2817731 RepID=UPI0028569DE2|nr:head-tail adaptor [Pseudorhodobacter sp. 4114]
MSRGLLRYKLRVLRKGVVDDGLQRVEAFAPFGHAIFAERRDISDAERLRSGSVVAEIATRFRVRRGTLANQITAADRLEGGGVVWAIIGPPKLSGDDDRMLEITCARAVL